MPRGLTTLVLVTVAVAGLVAFVGPRIGLPSLSDLLPIGSSVEVAQTTEIVTAIRQVAELKVAVFQGEVVADLRELADSIGSQRFKRALEEARLSAVAGQSMDKHGFVMAVLQGSLGYSEEQVIEQLAGEAGDLLWQEIVCEERGCLARELREAGDLTIIARGRVEAWLDLEDSRVRCLRDGVGVALEECNNLGEEGEPPVLCVVPSSIRTETTINPWYLPPSRVDADDGIAGTEVVRGEAAMSLDDDNRWRPDPMDLTRKHAENLLRRSAENADIETLGKASAVALLRGMFEAVRAEGLQLDVRTGGKC